MIYAPPTLCCPCHRVTDTVDQPCDRSVLLGHLLGRQSKRVSRIFGTLVRLSQLLFCSENRVSVERFLLGSSLSCSFFSWGLQKILWFTSLRDFFLSFIDPVLVFRILVLPAPLHIDGKRRFLGVVHWHRQEPRPAARVSNSRPQTEVRKTHKTVPGRIFGQSQLPFILVLRSCRPVRCASRHVYFILAQ